MQCNTSTKCRQPLLNSDSITKIGSSAKQAQCAGRRFLVKITTSKWNPVRHQHNVQVAAFGSKLQYQNQRQCEASTQCRQPHLNTHYIIKIRPSAMPAQSVGSRFRIQIPLSKLDPVRHQHRVQVATFALQVHYPIQTQCDTRYYSRFVLKFIIESYAVRRQHQVWVATFNFKFHYQNWTQCDTSTKCRWTLLG